MQYYFAPLEGLTDSIFRRLHHTYFPGVHRYYTPFFSPTVHRALTPRESRELPAADALGVTVVPQLLTKNPEDFTWFSGQCLDLGYAEVNLNLGCPSGTVTAKGKGSGMLRDLATLEQFLDSIYSAKVIDISIKTRIGFESPDEFPALLDLFNGYPIKELTIHPRVRKQFYTGNIETEAFTYAVKHSKIPLCYNGDLTSLSDVSAIQSKYPNIASVMVGRGLLADPGMFTPGGTEVKTLEAFHNALLEEYLIAFGGSRNAMFRLKEHWGMMIHRFENSEKLGKQLRKTTDIGEFRAITTEIFHCLPLKKQAD